MSALAQGTSTGSSTRTTVDDAAASGPIRLRMAPGLDAAGSASGNTAQQTTPPARPAPRPVYRPGEFEKFVQKLIDPTRRAEMPRPNDGPRPDAGNGAAAAMAAAQDANPPIRRFGAELMVQPDDGDGSAEQSPMVPPDYLVKSGDEIVVTLWGSVDGDLRTVVDRSGRITLPRVGPVLVAGVRYADLPDTISRRVAQVFKNFKVSASLGQLRGLRVYVTGYATQPGAYSVGSLSTLITVLAKAGGPSAAGSFRAIQLKRGSQVVSSFDLYDFLFKGDRGADRLLEAGDVIHVGPVGPQVALIGSVNQPAIFELKPGETVNDVLRMAGGFTAVADRSRLAVERLDDRADRRIRQLAMPDDGASALSHGDVLRAFSAVEAILPVQRQNKRIRIEGEVARPGEYLLPPESSITHAVRAAGGMTPAAYVFGTEFSRESVRLTQTEQYERALRDLETELAKASSSQRTTTADEVTAQTAQAAAGTRLVDRLRAVKPNGRIVLQLMPDSAELPDLALEDGDRIYIPPRPTTVGVFGSVFNAGSYLFDTGRGATEYLRLAGGPTRGADEASIFVIRANGSVVSGRQQNTAWFSRGNGLEGLRAEPGDTIFVPEEMNKTTFTQNLKDWTQILYQFGLGVAGIKSLGL